MDRAAAQALLAQVLRVYEQKTRQKPRRVVIHKSSFYTAEELEGFRTALDGIHFSDFVAVRNSEIRLLRLGNEPMVRGTAVHLGGQRFLLYTRGFVPYIRAYPGLRIPSPLEIHQHVGTGSIRKVCEEIMALTKMNWNTADFACSDPITMAFSRRVGEILAEMDRGQQPEASYRFYM